MIEKINKSFVPSWVIFNIDLFLGFLSISLAYLLRFNFRIPTSYSDILSLVILYVIITRALSFWISGTSKVFIRHASSKDFIRLIIVLLSGSVFFTLINLSYYFLVRRIYLIPTSVILIDFFIASYLMTSLRIFSKYFFTTMGATSSKNINVLIYGGRNLAISVKRALDLDNEMNYKVVGFISHNTKTFNKSIEGLTIYGPSEIEIAINKYDVKKLIFAETKIPADIKSSIVEKCLANNVKVFNVSNITHWIKEGPGVPVIKEIKIEDVLERDPIHLDITKISSDLKGKCILVTGAAGSIGSELVRQIHGFSPKKILLLDRAETPLYNLEQELLGENIKCDWEILIADINDEVRINKIFQDHQVQIIYHAAAYKHVPLMESHPDEAIKNNVFGSKILADVAVKNDVEKFVLISTDKAVNPTNIMGASKRIAELYTQSLNHLGKTCFITTRFGNVLGSNGSVIPLFKRQIEHGGPITVTHPDVTRYFMTITEACQLVLEAGVMGKGGEIFLFDMGNSIKIADLAKNMIKLAGYEVEKDIKIKFIGLRPGEKLYEELLNNKENTLSTYHPKIMIAKAQNYEHIKISQYISKLSELLNSDDSNNLVKLMKKIVPEFISQNSTFEKLDTNTDHSQKIESYISIR